MEYFRDPELNFGSPRRLAVADSLTRLEKLEILESWKIDLIEMQRAEEENMPSTAADDSVGKKLTEVIEVIASLERQGNDHDGGGRSRGVRQPPEKPHRPGHDVPEPEPLDNPGTAGPEGGID